MYIRWFVHIFSVHSVSFDKHIHLCNTNLCQYIENCHHPRKFPHAPSKSTPLLRPPASHIYLLISLSIHSRLLQLQRDWVHNIYKTPQKTRTDMTVPLRPMLPQAQHITSLSIAKMLVKKADSWVPLQTFWLTFS